MQIHFITTLDLGLVSILIIGGLLQFVHLMRQKIHRKNSTQYNLKAYVLWNQQVLLPRENSLAVDQKDSPSVCLYKVYIGIESGQMPILISRILE